jgi:polysaccharide deacetylase 2 family uncharacterized protein YibQ
MKDDLTKPLGLKPGRKSRGRELYWIAGGAGAVAVAAVAAGTWLLLPAAKGPVATAVIDAPTSLPPIAVERTGATTPPAPEGLSDMQPSGGLTDIDSGGEVVIHDPSAGPEVKLAALPDQDLVESSDTGPLPRVSAAGLRPLDAYARPRTGSPGDIRVAIVVGGLGLDPDGTRQAISSLPGEVTLAFAPYGETLAADTAAARAAGHELLLQIPQEPFNYPKTDPGPNTLTSQATPDENRSKLHWLLGRMTTYVGVMNYMGARFTSDLAALSPVIEEIGERGLLYVDDGSSARSKAAEAAGTATPFLRADIVLDADLSAAAIDDRLSQLRAIARERGYAVATATGFPITIDRIAAFAKAAASKGVTLVPVTNLVPGRS